MASLLQRRKFRHGLQLATRDPCSEETIQPVTFQQHHAVSMAILGKGSMATVHKARRLADGVEFAAKRVRTQDPEVQRFARSEHELLKSLNHPSVLKSYCMFEDADELWICLELCETGCVRSYVQENGPFTECAAKPLIRQLIEGVDFLHNKRIVHRDIKPENLLLKNNARELKIGDFNSACHLFAATGPVAMLSQRCTPLYSAPELRMGFSWNERVDVWGAGLSAYYMLLALLPFPKQLAKNTWMETDRPVISWRGVSAPFQDLIGQCLIIQRDMRPAAMELVNHKALVKEPQRRSTSVHSYKARPPRTDIRAVLESPW